MNQNSEFYVTSNERLASVIDLIRQVKVVAIDTEFTRETTYYPILSIIQLAVKNLQGEQNYFIIDVLSDLDLTGFYEIISDPEIVKILHSPHQDLQIFYHRSNLLPRGIIDTQTMANFCDMGFNIGYSNLVEKLFGEKLDKKQQRSDWQRRPLSRKQIEYAILDVKFLEGIYRKLHENLVSKNRIEWYFEEIKTFTNRVLSKSDDGLYKNFSFRGKSPKQIAQMRNLILWRDVWAQKSDVPRRHFMRDEVVEKIISGGIFGLNLKQEILDEIEKIMNSENEFEEFLEIERRFSMNEAQKTCYQEAKKLLEDISNKNGIESRFLVTGHDLKRSIFDQKFFNEKISGWRYQLFGKQLEQLFFES